MTNLLERIYDFANSEVTADVNNSLTDTDNINVAGGGEVEGLLSQAVEHGKALADDGKLYDSLATAEGNASDYIYAGPGTFSEEVVVETAGLTIEGSGRGTVVDSGTAGDALQANAANVTFRNIAAKSTSGQGIANDAFLIAADDCEVSSVWALEADRSGLRVGGNSGCRVVNVFCESTSIDDDDVNLAGSSSSNLVDDIVGTVTDNGTGNTVGETA